MNDPRPLTTAELLEVLDALGQVLTSRGRAYDVVLVGGANLLLRGIVDRSTMDADLIGTRTERGQVQKLDELPEPLQAAASDVASAYGLRPDWLNLGPADLLDGGMPEGFGQRLESRRFGGLTVWLAGREDLISMKLYAAATLWPSPGRHLTDLVALAPTIDENESADAWCRRRDPTPDFAGLLQAVLDRLDEESELA